MMSNAVQHLPGQNRYVFSKDGSDVGLIDYSMRGRSIVLTHSEIDPNLRHSGLGDEMVRDVLDEIRETSDLRVVADCPFVVDWLERHPDYQELESR
jgi:predicted GNAT family acetyltransferase